MKIQCTKEEYRKLIIGCADTARLQYCNMCALTQICEHENAEAGDWLSDQCEIVPEADEKE